MGAQVAERRLQDALTEQARLTRVHRAAVGTGGELSAYVRLQAATLAVNNCERAFRAVEGRAQEHFCFVVLCGLDGPRAARTEAARRVSGTVPQQVVDAVALLVSETVTNAVVHGAVAGTATVGISGQILADRLRFEVTNAGASFDHSPSRPPETQPDGRGLLVVDALSRDWGIRHSRGHTSVWFEVDREPSLAG